MKFHKGEKIIFKYSSDNGWNRKEDDGLVFTFERYNSCNKGLLCVKERKYQMKSEFFDLVVSSKTPEDWL